MVTRKENLYFDIGDQRVNSTKDQSQETNFPNQNCYMSASVD